MLEGVPMTLKDNLSTKDIETTCCSKILKGYKPIYNATVWENLSAQNAVMLRVKQIWTNLQWALRVKLHALAVQ